jgi:hypothetical protein
MMRGVRSANRLEAFPMVSCHWASPQLRINPSSDVRASVWAATAAFSTNQTKVNPMNKIKLFGLIGVAVLALATATTGCVSAITATGQGKVVTSVTETVLGLHVAEQTQSETPELDFGYTRTTVVLEPASTNNPIYVPPYANTFNFAQGTLFDFGGGESVASGCYQTAEPSGTNTVNSQPIVPK